MTDSTKYDHESRVTVELKKLVQDIVIFVSNATEEQKEALLQLLKDANISGLFQSWRKTDQRKAPRKECSLTMYYTAEDHILTGTLKNISTCGLFIETITSARVGQKITMTFWPANQQEPIEAKGEIVRMAPGGIGVKFMTASKDLEEVLAAL